MTINPDHVHQPDLSWIEQHDWQTASGEPLNCAAKSRIIASNALEVFDLAQEAFESALVMGCNETQLRTFFARLMASLHNPYESS